MGSEPDAYKEVFMLVVLSMLLDIIIKNWMTYGIKLP